MAGRFLTPSKSATESPLEGIIRDKMSSADNKSTLTEIPTTATEIPTTAFSTTTTKPELNETAPPQEMHQPDMHASAPASPAAPTPVQSISSSTKVTPGKVTWHPDFESACRASSASGKPVLLFQMMGRLDDHFC